MILHLGVIDAPYSEPPTTGRRRKRKAAGTQTTGDVAGWLEDKYHPMEIFYELHKGDVVAPALEESLSGAVESMLMGSPLSIDAFGSATSKIEDAFKQFLSNKEMDALGYPGVPTQAALRGVNHRLKNPYARRGPRPSFIDTGLYQASFKSWVD